MDPDEALTEQLMIRVSASTKERLETYRAKLAKRNLRLSIAAVARMALADGLDGLEKSARKRR